MILSETNTHRGEGHTVVFSSLCPIIIMRQGLPRWGLGWGRRWSTALSKKLLRKALLWGNGDLPNPLSTFILLWNVTKPRICFRVIQGEWGYGWRFRRNKTGHELITAEAGLWAWESLSQYPFLLYMLENHRHKKWAIYSSELSLGFDWWTNIFKISECQNGVSSL